MSAEQPEQTGSPQALQHAAPKLPSEGGQPVPGAIPPADSQNHEAALVKLYSDITGETESQARNAVIFVVRDKEDSSTTPPN